MDYIVEGDFVFNLALCSIVLYITTTKVQATHSRYSLTIASAGIGGFIAVESLSGGHT